MTQGGKHILCVGRIYCDLVFETPDLPRWGQETFCDGFSASAGGGAFITAAYLSALGHQLSLAGQAGAQEPFGAIIDRDLAACGIDGQQISHGQAPQVTVAMAAPEDRAFLTYRDPGLTQLPRLAGCDHIHVGELSTLLECPGLVDLARAQGVSLSCDCGDEAEYPPEVTDLIAALDIFAPNHSEWQTLQATGRLPDQMPGALVVKMGADGARLWQGDTWLHHPAAPATPRDPTGAGDAFNAGFLHGWLAGEAPETCLTLGARCGAAAVAAPGGWAGRSTIAAQKSAGIAGRDCEKPSC